MKDSPVVSIVVPVYNGAKYLCRCLDSIIHQEFEDFEIVVIDDGSTDESERLILDYALKDSRVCYYKQENSGVSVARNNGIIKARGVWVTFVDCDDEILPGFLSELLVHEKRYDLLVSGYQESYVECKIDYSITEQGVGLSVQEYLSLNISSCQVRAPWCKLFRRAWLESNTDKFDPDLTLGEDTIFNLEYLFRTPRIFQSPYIGYVWFRDHETSLTSRATPEQWVKFIERYLKILEQLLFYGIVSSAVICGDVFKKLRYVFFGLLTGPLKYKDFQRIMEAGSYLGLPRGNGRRPKITEMGLPLFVISFLGRGKICYFGVITLWTMKMMFKKLLK
tara:strand:- start:5832 stop:6836 length:1005 start_codon:yes stop_codon:yes gene_type:complete